MIMMAPRRASMDWRRELDLTVVDTLVAHYRLEGSLGEEFSGAGLVHLREVVGSNGDEDA